MIYCRNAFILKNMHKTEKNTSFFWTNSMRFKTIKVIFIMIQMFHESLCYSTPEANAIVPQKMKFHKTPLKSRTGIIFKSGCEYSLVCYLKRYEEQYLK